MVLDQTWKYDDDQNVQNIVLINNSNTCASKILMPMVSFSDYFKMVVTFQSSADNVEAVDNFSLGCSFPLIRHFQANIHKHKIMTSLSFSGTWLIVKNKNKNHDSNSTIWRSMEYWMERVSNYLFKLNKKSNSSPTEIFP